MPSSPPTAPPQQPPVRRALHRRLRALLAVRCTMVTLLLGSALAVNINNAASFDNPAYQGLTTVIIATYVMTVFGALWLRSGRWLEALALASYGVDALLAAALVVLTGRLESPFTYLFLMVALYGGVVDGRRGGIAAALCASAGVFVVLFFELGLFDGAWAGSLPGEPSPSPLFRSIMLSAAALSIGLLSGVLRERLDATTSDLVASEREVAALRSLHERILTSLRSGVVTTDARDVVAYANPAALTLLDRPAHQVLGASLEALGLTPPLAAGRDPRWECEIVRGDGEPATLGVSATGLEGDGQARNRAAGEVLTFQDLTELRRIERQLAHHERLATVGRFAASIAHEIRNPLASISGSVELLATSRALDGDDATLMRIISTEIDRLNGLVRAILDYAGPRNVVTGRVELGELLGELRRIFCNDPLAHGLELELELPDEAAVAAADPEVMRQVVLNLWRNAAQAIAETGAASGRIRTRVELGSRSVALLVEDSGPGVPQSARESLFEPFYTTREQGTGLGLATVFQLVAEMDGTVQLLMEHDEASTLGGALFEVRLPLPSDEPDCSGVGDSMSTRVPLAQPMSE